MGGLAPGQLKSRRGWHSSPRRLHYRFSFFDRVSRTHCGKNSINFAGMAHSHRHRLAAAWPSLVRQIGPVLRRRRQFRRSTRLSGGWAIVSGLFLVYFLVYSGHYRSYYFVRYGSITPFESLRYITNFFPLFAAVAGLGANEAIRWIRKVCARWRSYERLAFGGIA